MSEPAPSLFTTAADRICPYCRRDYRRDCLCANPQATARWLRWLMRERFHGAPCPPELEPRDTPVPPTSSPPESHARR